MMFLLRWPLVLILLAFIAANLFPAVITTAVHTDLFDVSKISSTLQALGQSATWWEAALWYGAALFLLIAMVRLVRQTQAFWAWLLGFACYGAHWALQLNQEQGGALAQLQSLTLDSFKPGTIGLDSLATQVLLVGGLFVVGLLIFIVDHGDRRYWNKQAAA
jgi:hypothetical protein